MLYSIEVYQFLLKIRHKINQRPPALTACRNALFGCKSQPRLRPKSNKLLPNKKIARVSKCHLGIIQKCSCTKALTTRLERRMLNPHGRSGLKFLCDYLIPLLKILNSCKCQLPNTASMSKRKMIIMLLTINQGFE